MYEKLIHSTLCKIMHFRPSGTMIGREDKDSRGKYNLSHGEYCWCVFSCDAILELAKRDIQFQRNVTCHHRCIYQA